MKQLLLIAVSLISLAGCMSPIGKEESTCPNSKKGGVCAGPREIYEMTNNRENLTDVVVDHKFNESAKKHSSVKTSARGAGEKSTLVYKEREPGQQSPEAYQRAEVIKPEVQTLPARDGFDSYPSNGEPLAPEPLAVINPPKVMRVLIASYKDAAGNLNMPGYVYVQVEPERWSFGEAANTRPSRVVPLEVRKQTQEEERKQAERAKGVSPLEYVTGGGK